MNAATIDVIIIFAYLLFILLFGTYFGKFIKTSSDFFLAGRRLAWWAIGMSIIGTNIGAYDYVGAAGGAYKFGIAQANYEWIGAIPAMIISALIFVPYYWRAGVHTVPEFLGRRYNDAVRLISAVIWGVVLILFLGIFLWAAGVMLHTYLGWDIYLSIIIVAVVMGIYTVSGGLEAVVMTDVVQLIIMVVGSVVILIVGFLKVGGIDGLIEKLSQSNPERLHLFLPLSNPDYPWAGIILGLAFVLSPAWWCCHQVIIQRCLGARREWDAKASMIFATFFKTLFAFFIILPGFFALILSGPGEIGRADQALPWAIRNLIPAGLSGLVLAAFIAAVQSTVDSTLNSLSTIWTKDIYQRFMKRDADDKHYLKVGRWLTVIFLVGGVLFAPVTDKFPGIYVAMQFILSAFQGPMFATMLLGILWKRATQWGGLFGLLGGVGVASLMLAGGINFLYAAWWSFLCALVLNIAISAFTKPHPVERLKNLVYGLVVKEQGV